MSAPIQNIRVKIYSAVNRALNCLLKGNTPLDDTVIHNFFDIVKLNVDSIDCIERMGLHTFIEAVRNSWNTSDSSTVVFGLQVTGWLAENDAFYRHFKSSIEQVYCTLCREVRAQTIADISVLTALYESLSLLANQEESLRWLVSGSAADAAVEGLGLLSVCSSIFLQKAVIKYLTKVTLQVENLDKDVPIPGYEELYSEILNTTVQNVKSHYTKNRHGPFTPGSVQFLESACKQSGSTCRYLLNQHTAFCEYLVELTGLLEARDCSAVISILQALLLNGFNDESCAEKSEMKSKFINRVIKQLTGLALDGNIVTAQRLAASCLKTQGSEKLHELCVAVLTEPLDWLVDKRKKTPLLSEDILQAALSTRCRCTAIVCRSLDGHLSQNLELSTVTDLLQRTTVFTGQGDQSNSKAVTFLNKNRAVQRMCLEMLVSEPPQVNGEYSRLLPKAEIIIELFREPDNDTVVYSLCSQLLVKWLPSLFVNETAASLRATLAQVLQYHLSALQWELRDTTLELLGKIMESYCDCQAVVDWIVEHRLHVQVWQCMKDGESYVRASAILALSHLYCCPQLLAALVASDMVGDEIEIIQTIADIVYKDTEAFARRSAMTFLFNFHKVKDINRKDVIPEVVIETIVAAAKDFDWEVKLVALDFITLILQHAVSQHIVNETEVPEYARELCNGKAGMESEAEVDISLVMEEPCNVQLLTVLLDALDDYDDKVCERALGVVSELQRALEEHCASIGAMGRKSGCRDQKSDLLPGNKRRIDCSGVNDTKKRKLDDEVSTANVETTKLFHAGKETSEELNAQNEILERSCEDDNDKMLNRILDFDLSVYKLRLENEHDSSAKLLSLVEDILTPEHKTGEDNAVDCY